MSERRSERSSESWPEPSIGKGDAAIVDRTWSPAVRVPIGTHSTQESDPDESLLLMREADPRIPARSAAAGWRSGGALEPDLREEP
jgi:hypothetical protein